MSNRFSPGERVFVDWPNIDYTDHDGVEWRLHRSFATVIDEPSSMEDNIVVRLDGGSTWGGESGSDPKDFVTNIPDIRLRPAETTDFKPGDKVKMVYHEDHDEYRAYLGHTLTVTSTSDDAAWGGQPMVQFRSGTNPGECFAYRLRLMAFYEEADYEYTNPTTPEQKDPEVNDYKYGFRTDSDHFHGPFDSLTDVDNYCAEKGLTGSIGTMLIGKGVDPSAESATIVLPTRSGDISGLYGPWATVIVDLTRSDSGYNYNQFLNSNGDLNPRPGEYLHGSTDVTWIRNNNKDKDTPMTNRSVYEKAVEYLFLKEHSVDFTDLSDAWSEIVGYGVRPTLGDAENSDYINQYLRDNPQGFCDGGIQKFRTATGVEEQVEKITFIVTLTVKSGSEYSADEVEQSLNDYLLEEIDSADVSIRHD